MRLDRAALSLLTVGALAAAAGCGAPSATSPAGQASGGTQASGAKVSVKANNGTVEVPANPKRVVALDNTSFQTLQAMGVTPVAVPKQLLPAQAQAWKKDADILDVGTHREPKIEVVDQAQPDLIVGGKRFVKYTDQLAKVAPVVDLAPSVEKEGYLTALKAQTTELGRIFGKTDVATKLNADLDAAAAEAKKAGGTKSVFLANHNGGKIDNGAGRIAPLLQPLDMTDVFGKAQGGSEAVHQDSGLAPETVAQANPDVMVVMDRDAATSTGTASAPASATIAAQKAWANTTFMKNKAIVYLDPTFYTTEGIQAYTDAYRALAKTVGQAA
ncbi:ABC transporter substrate-binding protein [Agilicoccus flavus]|uniref:ABC transporter substrate-binding protein n=1 Tax=Agilicoccus flavus TaxID=2775968 RepID=UPI001CF70662|nr:ABC transporter substrate-binding protein [Agilicoccus flavus]